MASRFAKFDDLINNWEPVLRESFRRSVYQLRNRAQVSMIVQRIEAGDVEGAVRAVGLDPVSFRPFDASSSAAFEAGANATLAGFPLLYDSQGFQLSVAFNMRNREAEQWLLDHSSRMITQVLDDQRTMIRDALQTGLEQGLNPRSIALDLVGRIGASGQREGGLIGLTSSQAEWVRNYRSELTSDNPASALERVLRDRRFDSVVLRAASRKEPIDADLVDKMVTAYKNRALRYRAEAIARTEVMASLHESQQQALEQSIASGAITADQVTFIWHTAEDNRVRDSHVPMDGQEVAMGEMFVTGDGNRLEFPGDPSGPPEEIINCRCWREPSVNFLAGIT